MPTNENTMNEGVRPEEEASPETAAGTPDIPEQQSPAPEEKPKPDNKHDKKKSAKQDEEIAKLKEQLSDANDKHLRLLAEFDNFRKRSQREKEAAYPDAVANTVTAMLPILDNFERALETPCADEGFLKGVTMIYDSLHSMLEAMGITEIGAVGEPFDPAIHNAVMHIEDDTLGKNVVSMVMQKGYRMGGRVLRFAMVQQAN